MKNYSYPLADDWTTDEIVAVTTLYQRLEDAYELNQGVSKQALLAAYQAFKEVVPSKSQEKQLGRQFETLTGYSLYRTMKVARETTRKSVTMVVGGAH